MKNKTVISIFVVSFFLLFMVVKKNVLISPEQTTPQKRDLKLFWFIPDGLRADPEIFKIYEWANEGLLPNVKRMMDRGSYGFSIPVFPGHTPTNTATLVTGSMPKTHGIADGSMHVMGYPLTMIVKSGFSSISKLVPPIWFTLEEQGANVGLISMPGSTPPELIEGITLKGRWGGWGLEFPAVNFQCKNLKMMETMNTDRRAFGFGSELTQFVEITETNYLQLADIDPLLPDLKSYSRVKTVDLENWKTTAKAWLIDTTDDQKPNYDRVAFKLTNPQQTFVVSLGEWSGWKPIQLTYETKNDYNIHTPKAMSWERSLSAIKVDTSVNIRVIRLGNGDDFRVRFFYDNLNEYSIKPQELSEDIHQKIGPMVDFVDNYPPQLVYFPEDKKTFLEEAQMSLDWHRKIINYMLKNTETDVILQNIYTPNQMLTSRWWLPFLDPKSRTYDSVSLLERKPLWNEVLNMYQKIDAILGEVLDQASENSVIVFSSDHGAIPLNKEICLNNLFAQKGWLKFKTNPKNLETEIDWDNTQVVYLQMNHVYINPKNLAGAYHRAKGDDYLKLRNEVIQAIESLKDPNGDAPLAKVLTWERSSELGLPDNLVGDLIIANKAGYHWSETINATGEIFKTSLKGGYKQAVLAESEKGMWTPFIIVGPGIAQNHPLPQPIRHIDQYPTIMKAMQKKIPPFVEGHPIETVFK